MRSPGTGTKSVLTFNRILLTVLLIELRVLSALNATLVTE